MTIAEHPFFGSMAGSPDTVTRHVTMTDVKFTHKGLRALFERDDRRRLDAAHVECIRVCRPTFHMPACRMAWLAPVMTCIR